MADLPGVRLATEADVPELSKMLARAFYDDPVATWAWRSDPLRLHALEQFQAVRIRQLLDGEGVWCNEERSCAALWAAPGRWRASIRETVELLPSFMRPRLFVRMPLVALGWMDLERKHPAKPEHWYLAVLGTEPEAQGRGLGSAVLTRMLQQCDSDGIGAFLESSKESNIDYYARHGFRVVNEVRLLKGPKMWKMWRDPLV
jgi:ribosomal protein S18 acetylase RimI-like enzyme